MVQAKRRNVATHLKDEHRQRQQKADPEPQRHVAQLMVGCRLGRYLDRFQGHAADRAAPGPLLPDFRVHRAGVGGVRPSPRRRLWPEVDVRVGLELPLTAGGAEVKGRARVLETVSGRSRVYLHSTHRVGNCYRLRVGNAVRCMTMVMPMFVH